jgi:hypothetical protein
MALLTINSSVLALPLHQEIPCFGGEGCPERVNPEPDEYYSIQCTTNGIWVWREVPVSSLVTLIPIFQVEALSDGGSLVAPGNVSVTRSGDTITLSGDSGNLAPQAGEKSFSLNECIERNGGLPELPFELEAPTDEEATCLRLPTEQETVTCLENLSSDSDTANTQTCEDPNYALAHWLEECSPINCRNILNALINRGECLPSSDAYEVWRVFTEYCFGPAGTSAAVVAVAAFRRRRIRK